MSGHRLKPPRNLVLQLDLTVPYDMVRPCLLSRTFRGDHVLTRPFGDLGERVLFQMTGVAVKCANAFDQVSVAVASPLCIQRKAFYTLSGSQIPVTDFGPDAFHLIRGDRCADPVTTEQ